MTLNGMAKWTSGLALLILLRWLPAPVEAQASRSSLEGMWSDPPSTAVGSFCAAFCTDAGLDRLNALLDNPVNDVRPFEQLEAEAKTTEREYIRSRLTVAALKTYPLDPADDPGFLRCEPWGVARQIFARHQLSIRLLANGRLELRYGEWDARRTIDMDSRKPAVKQPSSVMGHSVGRWDGDALVIDTSGIAANIATWPARHSDQLRVVERYTRSADGKTLSLSATMEDPATLREAVVIKKIWRWAPEQKIAPYTDCERPTEFKRGVKP